MPRRSPRTSAAAAALALLVAVSGRVEATPGADEGRPRTPAGETAATPPRVPGHAEWPRVRPWQYAGAGALLAGAFALRFAGPAAPDNWRGGVLFDDAVLDAVAVRDEGAARTIAGVTDVLFYGAMADRLVDSALVPTLVHGDADLALQMSMVDLTAFSVQAIVLWGSQTLVGRTRPIVSRCEREGLDADAGSCRVPSRLGPRRSFIAGHPATGVTAAGLTCLHHGHLALYGGAADSVACVVTIAAAAVNGWGRVAAEQHYPTDLLLGIALGGLSGWVVPSLLHYGFGASPSEPRAEGSATGARVFVLPFGDATHIGAVVGGAF
jgi:membrane-associated phospholipid phosphatase